MNTLFLVCFLVGLSLSVVSFASAHLKLHVKHGHHGHGTRARLSPFNFAAITAFLTWFGGAGMLLQQLTPFGAALLLTAAAVVGIAGGSLINRFLRSLIRREKPLQQSTMVGKI